MIEPPDTLSPPPAASNGRPLERPSLSQRLLTRAQLADLPQPEPLIADTLDRRTVALLAGHYGTAKSFLALDWSGCVATGRMWQRRAGASRPGALRRQRGRLRASRPR